MKRKILIVVEKGEVVSLLSANTIADGTAVKRPGDIIFPYIKSNIDSIIAIEDEELVVCFLDMVENHKMVVENTGLLTVAALRHLDVKGKRMFPFLAVEIWTSLQCQVFYSRDWYLETALSNYRSVFQINRENYIEYPEYLRIQELILSSWNTINLFLPIVEPQ